MAKALLIAEKPSLMRNIKSVYDKHRSEFADEIVFTSQVGHIVQLVSPTEYNEEYKKWDIDLLPINPAKEGGWRYIVSPSAKKVYADINKEIHSGKYAYIIHAGDADQEGELLVRLALQHMGNSLPVKRYWENAQNEKNVLDALKNLRNDNEEFFEDLYKSALVRQHADWLFGMNGSRAVASKLHFGYNNKIAVGRVMTWILTQVVNREDEIINFVPTSEYGAKMKCKFNNVEFAANYVADKKSPQYFKTEEEAKRIVSSLGNSATVLNVEKTKKETEPPKLYKLSTLQQDASKKGFDADTTLAIIQSLYEKKFLTYPRSDGEYLHSNDDVDEIIDSCACVQDCADYITAARSNKAEYKKNKRFVNDTEYAKHGHSAIVPTGTKPDFGVMTPSETTVYTMVAKRFIASMLPNIKANVVTAVLTNNGQNFMAKGRTVVDAGFNKLLKQSFTEAELPELKEGDVVTVAEKKVDVKTTKCPSRYTDGSMIAAMDSPAKYIKDEQLAKKLKGMTIGTSATRAAIISKLIEDKYMSRKKGELLPTQIGTAMIHSINTLSICQTEMTGNWEEKLKLIRSGEVDADEIEIYMMHEVENLISDVKTLNDSYLGGEDKPIGKCSCGGNIMKGAKRFYCNDCKKWITSSVFDSDIENEEAIKLFNGEELIKTVKYKKNSFKKKLYIDMNQQYPLQAVDVETESAVKCPKCHNAMTENGAWLNCSCGFKVYRVPGGVTLTDKQLTELFDDGRTKYKVKGLTSKNGKHFEAFLKFDGDRISYDFDTK